MREKGIKWTTGGERRAHSDWVQLHEKVRRRTFLSAELPTGLYVFVIII